MLYRFFASTHTPRVPRSVRIRRNCRSTDLESLTTQLHTHRQTDRRTDKQTDRINYTTSWEWKWKDGKKGMRKRKGQRDEREELEFPLAKTPAGTRGGKRKVDTGKGLVGFCPLQNFRRRPCNVRSKNVSILDSISPAQMTPR